MSVYPNRRDVRARPARRRARGGIRSTPADGAARVMRRVKRRGPARRALARVRRGSGVRGLARTSPRRDRRCDAGGYVPHPAGGGSPDEPPREVNRSPLIRPTAVCLRGSRARRGSEHCSSPPRGSPGFRPRAAAESPLPPKLTEPVYPTLHRPLRERGHHVADSDHQQRRPRPGHRPIAIAFSEPVTGFELEDLVVGNGSASELQGNNATYTATITPRPPAP